MLTLLIQAGLEAGQPCQSSCTPGKSSGKCNAPADAYGPACSGLNVPGGNSTCTAGQHAGCFCDSICPSFMACNANGCMGVNHNNVTGEDGICTAGDYRGCNCKNSCSSKTLTCRDPECSGIDSYCQAMNDNFGCTCYDLPWPAPSVKRSLLNFFGKVDKRVTGNPNPPAGSPQYDYYTCDDPNQQQGSQTYSRSNLIAYVASINRLLSQQGQIQSRTSNAGQSTWYPRQFHAQGHNYQLENNPNTMDLVEFPLTFNAQRQLEFDHGMDQGPDRVVIEARTGNFVGVFTHRGGGSSDLFQAQGFDVAGGGMAPGYFEPYRFYPGWHGGQAPNAWRYGNNWGSGIHKRDL